MTKYKNNIAVVLLLLLVLMGCRSPKRTVGANEANVPHEFHTTDTETPLDTSSSLAELSYREFFRDQNLITLIDSGLSYNNNMLVAIKQIEIAEEAVKQVKWGHVPIVDLAVGAASINRPSDNSMNGRMASQFMGKSYMEDYSTRLSMSWEADIWGKIKNRKAAALATYLESKEAVNAVRTSLIAGIAKGYYDLLLFDQQKEISTRNLAIIDSTLEITKVQQQLGLTTSLAVRQVEISRVNLLKSIRVIEENITVQEYALNALVGRMPDHIKYRGQLGKIEARAAFATGVPATLLSRRPDIKQAEFRFLRSVSEVNIARANMYPSLRITAEGGLNSFKASNWFNIPGSLFGMVAGSLTQPLLDGRRLKTEYNQAGIRTDQAEIQFKESVLQAVSEVSTILEQLASLREQQVFNDDLVAKNLELIEQAKILFKNDMATYLEILLAQQTKLQAELDQMLVKSELLYAEVALYRALGGGIQ